MIFGKAFTGKEYYKNGITSFHEFNKAQICCLDKTMERISIFEFMDINGIISNEIIYEKNYKWEMQISKINL